jgi:hypothetical protein
MPVLSKGGRLVSNDFTGPSSGLIAHYPFNGNANDASGNGNNGTVFGATLDIGRQYLANTSYKFNKPSNDYISINSVGHLSTISISLWFKYSSNSNFGLISKSNFSSSQGDYNIIIASYPSGNDRVIFRIANNAVYQVLSSNTLNLNNNTWRHVVAICNGTILKLYVDYSDYNTVDAGVSITDVHSLIRIGQYYSSSFSLKGNIADVRIYNRELTLSEINLLYNEKNHIIST